MQRKLTRKRLSNAEDDQVNPMEGIANLADVMLCLAVGIMLALVMNWNVDLSVAAAKDRVEETPSPIEFSEEEMEKADDNELPGGDELTKLGVIYYDAVTGKYYIIASNATED